MENILLSQILTAILEFKQDPTPENDAKVHEFMAKLQVVPYLSINRKIICAATITSNVFNVKRDAIASSTHLFVAKTVYGVLEYCVNLENDLGGYVVDETICDALYEFGFVDYILKFCGEDYKRLCEYVDSTINFANIYKIVESAEYFKSDNIDALVEEIREARKELTPEMLSDMKSIINGSAPEWKALKETVVDEALGNALDKDISTILGKETTPRKKAPEGEKEPEGEHKA